MDITSMGSFGSRLIFCSLRSTVTTGVVAMTIMAAMAAVATTPLICALICALV